MLAKDTPTEDSIHSLCDFSRCQKDALGKSRLLAATRPQRLCIESSVAVFGKLRGCNLKFAGVIDETPRAFFKHALDFIGICIR